MLRRQDLTARVPVIDKTLMTAPYLRKRDTFSNFLVRLILTHDYGMIQDAIVILDESVKSKRSKQHLAAYPRRELNTGHAARKIREVRYHTSHTDNLVRAQSQRPAVEWKRC